ncbi:hypothetical protein D3C78_1587850 [compost metagenome]
MCDEVERHCNVELGLVAHYGVAGARNWLFVPEDLQYFACHQRSIGSQCHRDGKVDIFHPDPVVFRIRATAAHCDLSQCRVFRAGIRVYRAWNAQVHT